MPDLDMPDLDMPDLDMPDLDMPDLGDRRGADQVRRWCLNREGLPSPQPLQWGAAAPFPMPNRLDQPRRRGAVMPSASVGRREMRLAHLHQAGPAILAINQAENRPHDRTPLFDQCHDVDRQSFRGHCAARQKWFLRSPEMVSSNRHRAADRDKTAYASVRGGRPLPRVFQLPQLTRARL